MGGGGRLQCHASHPVLISFQMLGSVLSEVRSLQNSLRVLSHGIWESLLGHCKMCAVGAIVQIGSRSVNSTSSNSIIEIGVEKLLTVGAGA